MSSKRELKKIYGTKGYKDIKKAERKEKAVKRKKKLEKFFENA